MSDTTTAVAFDTNGNRVVIGVTAGNVVIGEHAFNATQLAALLLGVGDAYEHTEAAKNGLKAAIRPDGSHETLTEDSDA
jgi:hypothetical protein